MVEGSHLLHRGENRRRSWPKKWRGWGQTPPPKSQQHRGTPHRNKFRDEVKAIAGFPQDPPGQARPGQRLQNEKNAKPSVLGKPSCILRENKRTYCCTSVSSKMPKMVPVLMAASMLDDPSRGSNTATNLLLNASSTSTGWSSSSEAITPSLPVFGVRVVVVERKMLGGLAHFRKKMGSCRSGTGRIQSKNTSLFCRHMRLGEDRGASLACRRRTFRDTWRKHLFVPGSYPCTELRIVVRRRGCGLRALYAGLPLDRRAFLRTSLEITSSFFCSSPCTLTDPPSPCLDTHHRTPARTGKGKIRRHTDQRVGASYDKKFCTASRGDEHRNRTRTPQQYKGDKHTYMEIGMCRFHAKLRKTPPSWILAQYIKRQKDPITPAKICIFGSWLASSPGDR